MTTKGELLASIEEQVPKSNDNSMQLCPGYGIYTAYYTNNNNNNITHRQYGHQITMKTYEGRNRTIQ